MRITFHLVKDHVKEVYFFVEQIYEPEIKIVMCAKVKLNITYKYKIVTYTKI